jgi:UDP-N-acetyl-D-mannosaminuronic acid transferase (WecB/TagA/CpsF family)
MKKNNLKILGIDFFNGQVQDVVQKLKFGGLMVVPAAPALITIKTDTAYYQSLLDSDVVIADSGYMVLIWNLMNREKVNRISGLTFLVDFFADKEVKAASSMVLVDPTPKDSEANIKYLNSIGFNLSKDVCYLAPMYDKSNIVDPELVAFIEKRKPAYVVINLGGGTQEKLGAYLKKNLSYKPAIICTGAAIAFLTGRQAAIPTWADKSFLGWLFRCIEKPKLYVPRYLKAFKLLVLMIQYGKKAPVENVPDTMVTAQTIN